MSGINSFGEKTSLQFDQTQFDESRTEDIKLKEEIYSRE